MSHSEYSSESPFKKPRRPQFSEDEAYLPLHLQFSSPSKDRIQDANILQSPLTSEDPMSHNMPQLHLHHETHNFSTISKFSSPEPLNLALSFTEREEQVADQFPKEISKLQTLKAFSESQTKKNGPQFLRENPENSQSQEGSEFSKRGKSPENLQISQIPMNEVSPEASVGLSVSAAEATAIMAILGEDLFQYASTATESGESMAEEQKLVTEIAVKVRTARKSLGLDRYSLENPNHEEANDWDKDLEYSLMIESYQDVGLDLGLPTGTQRGATVNEELTAQQNGVEKLDENEVKSGEDLLVMGGTKEGPSPDLEEEDFCPSREDSERTDFIVEKILKENGMIEKNGAFFSETNDSFPNFEILESQGKTPDSRKLLMTPLQKAVPKLREEIPAFEFPEDQSLVKNGSEENNNHLEKAGEKFVSGVSENDENLVKRKKLDSLTPLSLPEGVQIENLGKTGGEKHMSQSQNLNLKISGKFSGEKDIKTVGMVFKSKQNSKYGKLPLVSRNTSKKTEKGELLETEAEIEFNETVNLGISVSQNLVENWKQDVLEKRKDFEGSKKVLKRNDCESTQEDPGVVLETKKSSGKKSERKISKSSNKKGGNPAYGKLPLVTVPVAQEVLAEKSIKRGEFCGKEVRESSGKKHENTSEEEKRENEELRQKKLLEGVKIIMTGFSSQQRSSIGTVIISHGGKVLKNVPEPPEKPTALVAPKEVRTFKYMYSCIFEVPAVLPQWIFSSTSKGQICPVEEFQVVPESLAPRKNLMKPFYSLKSFRILLSGSPIFKSNFKSLLKWSGAEPISMLKSATSASRSEKSTEKHLTAVVVETGSKLPKVLQKKAEVAKVPILDQEWLVLSILNKGAILFDSYKYDGTMPEPCGTEQYRKKPRRLSRKISDEFVQYTPENSSETNRGGNFEEMERKSSLDKSSKTEKNKRKLQNGKRKTNRVEEISLGRNEGRILRSGKKQKVDKVDKIKERCPENSSQISGSSEEREEVCFFLGEAFPSLYLATKGVENILNGGENQVKSPESITENYHLFKAKKSSRKYFSAAKVGDLLIIIGDCVALRPHGEGDAPYIGRIQAMFIESDEVAEKYPEGLTPMLRCQWYYRPNETPFSSHCLGPSELFASSHFDDVPLGSVVKKVKVVELSRDSESQGFLKQATKKKNKDELEFACRFHYNHKEESLSLLGSRNHKS